MTNNAELGKRINVRVYQRVLALVKCNYVNMLEDVILEN